MACLIDNRALWWPGGRIPFVISDTDFPQGSDEREEILEGIALWNATEIQLVPRTTEANFLRFVVHPDNKRCSSLVGMNGGAQGGAQRVQCDVGEGFSGGRVAHEIGHAIGLFHEHQRNDRDEWVEVDWSGIGNGTVNQNDVNYGINQGPRLDICVYDYDSIMHYCDTNLTKKKSGPTIGQRDHLSHGDKSVVRYLYATLSLRDKLEELELSAANGVAQFLGPDMTLREWLACTVKLFGGGGGGF